jgi:hypothetical protein
MTQQITARIAPGGSSGMADQQPITVCFVHPTDSARTLTATVGGTATPHYLLDQLVKNNFLTKPGAGAEYKLVDTKTGTELTDHATLAGAGVVSGTTLNVLHSVTGA